MPTPPLRILSAGSLRDALTAHAAAQPPRQFDLVFGPAGLLRERIEQGEACDLFLSASMEHPMALARPTGCAAVPFARNRLVAVARKRLGLRADNFLDRLLAADTRLGTSTPKADPSGDYAYALFRKAERMRPGAEAILAAKAAHLVGGRVPAVVPDGRNAVAYFLTDGVADVFLGYLSGARIHAAEFDVVMPPAELQVIAEYGLLITATSAERRRAAADFVASLLAPQGQARLVAHGFDAAR